MIYSINTCLFDRCLFFCLYAYDKLMTKKKCPWEQVKGLIRFHCRNDTFMTENKCFCVKGERVILSLQLNSCQAKDKPPRPLRSERSRKADGTASSRIACQESTLWQCDNKYSLMSRFLRLTSRSLCAP